MFKSFLAKIVGIIAGAASFVAPAHYTVITAKPVAPILQTQTQIATTTNVATSTMQKIQNTQKNTAAKKVVPPKITAQNSQKTSVKIAPIIPQATTTPTTQTPTTDETVPNFAAINTFARTAIVNIFCTANGDELSPISGTGIIVTSGGLILTNAHVAEYFLLRNYQRPNFLDCVIRTGSPATATYDAELVYISPTWVENNTDILKEQDPTGTGENDFGFLQITDAIDGAALTPFPHIPLNISEDTAVGEPVLLVSYPAGFLGGQTISQGLSVASGQTIVQNLFTFATDTTDIISVGGTVLSQKGSSGGAVLDGNASVIGMITLSSSGDTTSSRSLYAITPAYINRDLQSELGTSLADFLGQNIQNFAQTFQTNTAPLLTKLLTEDLNTTTPTTQ